MRGAHGERAIGSFAGFKLFVAGSLIGGPEVLLRGAATHQAKVSESALGTMRSVEYAVQNLDEVALNLEQQIKDNRKRVAELSAQCGQPFEYSKRLEALIQRQQEIADSLDLTKNQASSRLEASPTPRAGGEEGVMTLGEVDFPEYDY
jgi:TolA-binding protein